jgi:hypothetical protein
MVGEVVGGDEVKSESPWERILLDIARPILESDDIRQALDQAEADSDALNEVISTQSSDLILSGPSATTSFVQRVDLHNLLLSLSVLKFAGTLLLMLAAIVMLNVGPWGLPDWKMGLYNFLLIAIGGFASSIFLADIELLPGPLEPTESTREELAREVLGPLVREEINRMLDEKEHPAVLHVMSAPGLAELASRERLVATRALRTLGRLRGVSVCPDRVAWGRQRCCGISAIRLLKRQQATGTPYLRPGTSDSWLPRQ